LNLPGELQDYIIVHELCHLKELNHGRKFWELVREAVPNYKEMRNKLKNSRN
jgi:predicted metal-dependent hydrolase